MIYEGKQYALVQIKNKTPQSWYEVCRSCAFDKKIRGCSIAECAPYSDIDTFFVEIGVVNV
jgi:hypothetical protein